MMMNKALAFVALACIWQYGDCTITGWAPALTGGAATHTSEINAGLTNGESTGLNIVATSGTTGLTYTSIANVPATPTFTIADATGLLSVGTGTVVYSTATPTFVFTVIANDADGTASTASVTVSINQLPVFPVTSGSFCVPTGVVTGYDVTQYIPTDADTGDTITLAFASGNTGTAFEIIAASGVIQVVAATALTSTTYTLVITATDNATPGGVATATATVSVQATCSSAITVALSLMTILAALIVTKLA